MGQAETGPHFGLIGASGFLMATGWLKLRCGIFVPAYGCGRCAAGSVLRMGLVVGAGIYCIRWVVGPSVSVWLWGRRRPGRV